MLNKSTNFAKISGRVFGLRKKRKQQTTVQQHVNNSLLLYQSKP